MVCPKCSADNEASESRCEACGSALTNSGEITHRIYRPTSLGRPGMNTPAPGRATNAATPPPGAVAKPLPAQPGPMPTPALSSPPPGTPTTARFAPMALGLPSLKVSTAASPASASPNVPSPPATSSLARHRATPIPGARPAPGLPSAPISGYETTGQPTPPALAPQPKGSPTPAPTPTSASPQTDTRSAMPRAVAPRTTPTVAPPTSTPTTTPAAPASPPSQPAGFPAARPTIAPPPQAVLVSTVFDAPFPLIQSSTVTIGRGDENNVMLPVNQVSRVHAVIKWDGEGFAVIDKKSTNGTYVNDEVVSRRRLKHGDRIGVGPFELRFLDVGADVKALTPMADSTTGVISIPGAFSGDLSELATAEILQLIELHQKNGILIFHAGQHRGRMYFANGRAVHAEYREAIGDAAALELLALTQGRFRFFAREVTIKATIDRPVQSLLLESARMQDERNPQPPS